MMPEQLTACGDWWDKLANNLTSQGKRGAEEAPWNPGGKRPKGGGQGGSSGASGSGHSIGGAQREREGRPDRDRPANRDGQRYNRPERERDRDGGRHRSNSMPAPSTKVATDSKEDKNPFELKWHTSPTYLPQHSIWVINSNHAKRASLSAENRCFICKDKGHLARDCPQMEAMYKQRKACYYQRK